MGKSALGGAATAAVALLGLCACGSSSPPPGGLTVREGHARFAVLTPTLIRVEYADDDQFEDGPTQTVLQRSFPPADSTTAIEDGALVIRTRALTLRYVQGSGPFTAQNLSVELRVGTSTATARPDWAIDSNPQNLGGWRRSLDNDQTAQTLHNGLLSRAGWFLLDDSPTVLMTATAPGFTARPAHAGSYQDGYFFGYGHDYARGLADLRALTGPAPLLPRKAFGVWFSRYWAYSEQEIRDLIAQFRANRVPLDTLSLDTDWKLMHDAQGCVFFDQVAGARQGDPCSWNGWSWNLDLFPDPPAFVSWAHAQGLSLTANIHPSIDSTDPAFTETQTRAGGTLQQDQATPPCTLFQADPNGQCYVFDWTDPRHLDAYFALHAPIEASGIDFWWLDWCCDGTSATAPGLTADTWINSLYAQDNHSRGQRWPAFSRIGASFQEGQSGNGGAGAFAEHRYTMHFTGDTCATWEMLAFEAQMTAAEGSIGLPYVTHDIGSFLGPPLDTSGCNGTAGHTSHLPDDFYVRWLQFGVFQPLDRLHSHHGDRLPWDYSGAAQEQAAEFLRLRERLVPYLYTLAREAYDTGLPMVRALYLQWPEEDQAYAHPTEYTLGHDMLVAPVTSAGNPATTSVWIPPGRWIDYFTGESLTGPATVDRSVPYERYPVFMRAGAILPTQSDLPTSSAGPQDALMLSTWSGDSGSFDLYEDAGQGFAYRDGAYARTHVSSGSSAQGCASITVDAAQGQFTGALGQRSWTVRWIGIPQPDVVKVNGAATDQWTYDAVRSTLTAQTGMRPTDAPLRVSAGPDACP